jgi:integral membrane sensor domain MASE1
MIAAARGHGLRRHTNLGVQILLVATAYYLSAQIGLELALVRGQVTPLWPPTGIGLACMLLLGLRTWPGITLGALLVNAAYGPSLLAVVAISAGNTAGVVCAYLLLRRVGFRVQLDRLKDALALVFLGAFVGMLASATIGAGTLVLAEAIPAGRFAATWSIWWTGDAMGVLVVAPVLLVAATLRWRPWNVPPIRLVEAAGLLLGTGAVMFAVIRTPVPLLFLAFPFLIWAALRFQLAGAAPCALVVSVITVLAATAGSGPFAEVSQVTTMITLQAFNASAALTALLLAAVTAERDQAHRAVERACVQLAYTVAELEPHSSLRGGGLLDSVRQWSRP